MTTSVRTNSIQEPTAFWLTEPCPTWCDMPEMHRAEDVGEDRTHNGELRRLVTTTMDVERSEVDGRVCRGERPPHLMLYLQQGYREVEPRVWVGRDDTNQGVYLTLSEAEQLAATLVDLVKDVR